MKINKKKKIFYTFSSKGTFQKIYFDIANIITKAGFSIEYKWYDTDIDKDSEFKSNHEIYNQVNDAIRASDLVVADISISSTGVGLQIEYAKQKKIPIIILYNKTILEEGKYHLGGTQTPYIKYLSYEGLDDIREKLPKLLSILIEDKSEKLNFIATSKIKAILNEESIKQNVSMSELLRNIITEWFSDSQN